MTTDELLALVRAANAAYVAWQAAPDDRQLAATYAETRAALDAEIDTWFVEQVAALVRHEATA
jgi:hypothetical protein